MSGVLHPGDVGDGMSEPANVKRKSAKGRGYISLSNLLAESEKPDAAGFVQVVVELSGIPRVESERIEYGNAVDIMYTKSECRTGAVATASCDDVTSMISVNRFSLSSNQKSNALVGNNCALQQKFTVM